MASDGTVKIDTDLDSSGLKSGLGKVGSVLSGVGGLASKGLAVTAGAITAVTAAMGAGAAAGVSYNATMESYQTSFATMLGSADEAIKLTETLTTLGASTPFEMTDLANTTQTLMSFGLTADESVESLKMLGDISQGNADKLGTVSRAFGKMSSSGKVSLEDINMMIDAGFNPLQEISETTGESMASLYERISDGGVKVDEITASMQRATSEGGMYFGSMEAQSKTFNGMMSTLQDNAMGLVGTLTGGLQAELTGSLLPMAIESIGSLSEAFKTGGVSGLVDAGVSIVSNLIVGITGQIPYAIEMATSVISGFLESLMANSQALADAGTGIITGLITAMTVLLPQILQLGAWLLIRLLEGLSSQMPTLMFSIQTMLFDMLMVLYDNLPQILNAGVSMLLSFINGIATMLPVLMPLATDIILLIVDTLLNNIDGIIDAGINLLYGLINGLIEALPTLMAAVPRIISALMSAFIQNYPKIVGAGLELMAKLALGILSGIVALLGGIPQMYADIKEKFLSMDWKKIGLNIIDGVINGIVDAGGKLVETAKKAAGKAVDGLKDFLGIHSPSTLMRDQVGRYMAEGIGVGFETETPGLITGVKGNMSALVNGIKSEVANVGANLSIGSGVAQSVYNTVSGGSIDYNKLGAAVTSAFISADIGISVNNREFGRVIANVERG